MACCCLLRCSCFLFFFFFFLMIRRPPRSTLFPYTNALPISDQRPPLHAAQPGEFLQNRARSPRSEEHTSELQSPDHLVCRLLLEKKKNKPHIVDQQLSCQRGDNFISKFKVTTPPLMAHA